MALRPNRRAADILPAIDLRKQIPESFGEWQLDNSLVPILPNPSVQAKLDEIYNQVIARTYINRVGQRVMLSIAYGADQGSDSTSVHRPEFCYSAQGFVVQSLGEASIELHTHRITTRRLVGRLGSRVEPISYWITLNDRALMPGLQRKLQQIQLGISGLIPDGLLFRMSTIGLPQSDSFALHERFAAALEKSIPSPLRPRYFGKL